MKRTVKMGVGVAAGALVLAAAGVGVADADGHDVTGPTGDQARAAATQAAPGGKTGGVDHWTNTSTCSASCRPVTTTTMMIDGYGTRW